MTNSKKEQMTASVWDMLHGRKNLSYQEETNNSYQVATDES